MSSIAGRNVHVFRGRCRKAYCRAKMFYGLTQVRDSWVDDKRDLWWVYIERIDDDELLTPATGSSSNSERKLDSFKMFNWEDIVLPGVSVFSWFVKKNFITFGGNF